MEGNQSRRRSNKKRHREQLPSPGKLKRRRPAPPSAEKGHSLSLLTRIPHFGVKWWDPQQVLAAAIAAADARSARPESDSGVDDSNGASRFPMPVSLLAQKPSPTDAQVARLPVLAGTVRTDLTWTYTVHTPLDAGRVFRVPADQTLALAALRLLEDHGILPWCLALPITFPFVWSLTNHVSNPWSGQHLGTLSSHSLHIAVERCTPAAETAANTHCFRVLLKQRRFDVPSRLTGLATHAPDLAALTPSHAASVSFRVPDSTTNELLNTLLFSSLFENGLLPNFPFLAHAFAASGCLHLVTDYVGRRHAPVEENTLRHIQSHVRRCAAERQLPVQSVAARAFNEITLQLLAALALVDRQTGMVIQDVTPDNILLCPLADGTDHDEGAPFRGRRVSSWSTWRYSIDSEDGRSSRLIELPRPLFLVKIIDPEYAVNNAWRVKNGAVTLRTMLQAQYDGHFERDGLRGSCDTADPGYDVHMLLPMLRSIASSMHILSLTVLPVLWRTRASWVVDRERMRPFSSAVNTCTARELLFSHAFDGWESHGRATDGEQDDVLVMHV